MGIREFTNKRPKSTVLIAVGAMAVAALVGYLEWRALRPKAAVFPTFAFYTTDDGVTLFSDDAEKYPPFDHEGKPAVRAHVYTCDGGSHRWVQYLEKYSDESIAQLSGPPSSKALEVLVKAPGSPNWFSRSSAAALKVIVPKCPDGGDSTSIEPVFPSH